jgi:ABC-2 type transport system permease protein
VTLLVPIIVLVSWQNIVATMGGPFAMSSAITIGIVAVGLMSYANSTARSREKGIFQRLRVTPATTFDIMASRVIVQLVQLAAISIALFIAAYFIDHIVLSPAGYILGTLVSMLCGAVFLSLGLLVVALLDNAETVNAVSRLVYIVLVLVGAIGELGVLGVAVKDIILWSPYGSVKMLLLASMEPSAWSMTDTYALLASIAYFIVFTAISVRFFKWETK